ncbi:MAG: hypothetical protein ACFFBP_16385 [Promethearchaeota archaeon]
MLSEELIEPGVQSEQIIDFVDFKRLKKSLWIPIAKNEIRIRTSALRNYRKMFFLGLYGFLTIWAFILAPLLFDAFMPQLASIEEISSIFLPMIGVIIEFLMMMFFLILLMYPMNIVYRKTEIGFKETLLASPTTAGDIFMGEFMGKMPIYLIAVLIFAPIVVGLVNPIISLTFIQQVIIYTCIFGLVFLGNLMGTIMASWIEHRISKSEKARDMGKALIMVLTIVMIIIMYSLMFFFQFLFENPGLRNWLNLYPSLWFSNIIQFTIEPSLIETYVLDIWTSSLLAVIVPLVILYIAYKKASSFYSLEGSVEKESAIIKEENLFYRFMRIVSGRKWGGLIVTQYKQLLRKKENIARMAFSIGLVGFMGWFMGSTMDDIFGLTLGTTLLTTLGGAVFSIMVGHLIFIDSKDLVWVYKRSPRGINSLVYSYFLMLLTLNLLIGIGFIILLSIFLKLDLITSIFFYFTFVGYTQICFVQTIGIQCISPAFEIKGKNMQSNAMISMVLMQIPMFLIIFGMIGLDRIIPVEILLYVLLGITFLVNTVISVPLFLIGLKKLNKIE